MKEKDNNEKSEKRAARSIGGGKKSLFIKIGIIAGAAVLVLIIVYICLYRGLPSLYQGRFRRGRLH